MEANQIFDFTGIKGENVEKLMAKAYNASFILGPSQFNIPLGTKLSVLEVSSSEKFHPRATEENPYCKLECIIPEKGVKSMIMSLAAFLNMSLPINEKDLPRWDGDRYDKLTNVTTFLTDQVEAEPGKKVVLHNVQVELIGWYMVDARAKYLQIPEEYKNWENIPRYNDNWYVGANAFKMARTEYNKLEREDRNRAVLDEAEQVMLNAGLMDTKKEEAKTLGANPDPMQDATRKAINTFPIYKLSFKA